MNPADLPTVDPNSARIEGLVARAARRAVLFRRSPSTRVRLLAWDLKSDEVTPGQWLRGRIYPRRCDLSPDGERLIYFAASFRKPYYSWTAISKPPYLTALALWPKGDCWGGGGLFDARDAVRLNHRPAPACTAPNQIEMALAPGFDLPGGFAVTPFGPSSGWGEDDPIHGMRLVRDGWAYDQTPPGEREHGLHARFWLTYDPPVTRLKPLLTRRQAAGNRHAPLTLRVRLHALLERGARWRVETADVVREDGRVVAALGRVDWADADHNGDVLLAAEGKIFRLRHRLIGRAAPDLIADLDAMRFEAIAAPQEARRW